MTFKQRAENLIASIAERRYPTNEELAEVDVENEIGTIAFEEVTVRGLEKAIAAARYN